MATLRELSAVLLLGLFVAREFIEGLLHVSTMTDDFYQFVKATNLMGSYKKAYQLGQKVKSR